MEALGFVLFTAAWCAGVASWFLAIGESIGIWRFSPWVFRTGIRVFQETLSVSVPTVGIGSEFETKHGKFKLVAPGLCLFRFRMRWFSLDFYTPFPIKGILWWDGTVARVEGRIPVFTTVFFAAWLVGWTVGGAMATFQEDGLLGGIGFLLFGWVFAVGICVFSIPFEIRRVRKVLSELHATL